MINVGIVQRILPGYRQPFFDSLAKNDSMKVCIFAGEPRDEEAIKTTDKLSAACLYKAVNIHLSKGKTYFCWQKGLLKWFLTFKPDVIVVEANPRIISNWIIVLIRLFTKTKIIGWGLGMLPWNGPAWLLFLRRKVLGFFYNIFNGMISYSYKGAQDYVNSGVKKENITVATNAVDTTYIDDFLNSISTLSNTISEIKDSYSLHSGLTILYVGRLLPEKKIDNLIKACSKLKYEYKLLIVGDGPEQQSLEKMSDRLKCQVMFTGHLSGIDLKCLFYISDLFVLPGTGGLAVQEAMSYGKAVIVAQGDGTERDLINDGKNGILVRPGSIEDLQNAINKLYGDPDERLRMGIEARNTILKEWNMKLMVDRYSDAIRKTLR